MFFEYANIKPSKPLVNNLPNLFEIKSSAGIVGYA